MSWKIDLEKLENLYRNENPSLSFLGKSKLLFLPMYDTKYQEGYFKQYGFYGILGQFTRNLLGVKMQEQFSQELILDRVVNKVHANEEDRNQFRYFLEEYLFGESDTIPIRVFHPRIFGCFPLSDGKERGMEEKIAQFLLEVIIPIEQREVIKSYFENGQASDLLNQLIIDSLDFAPDKKHEKQQYVSKLDCVTNLFIKDFWFISKHESFFTKYFPLLLNYYYFLYVSQIAMKLCQFEKADYEHIVPLYFFLDWEQANKRRKAYNQGYKFLEHQAKKTFVHIHCLTQLSHVSNENNEQIFTYREIYEKFIEKDIDERKEFLDSVNQWIKWYCGKKGIDSPEPINDFNQLFSSLYSVIDNATDKRPKERFGGWILSAAQPFLRNRGRLGRTLNISQDFLILMTAVCVRDQRISLNTYFTQLKERGLYFDRDSLEEIKNLLTKLNLLEKKSDSGDAQYVKPIL